MTEQFYMGLEQVLSLQIRVMIMKRYSTFNKAPELELHYQFNVIPRILKGFTQNDCPPPPQPSTKFKIKRDGHLLQQEQFKEYIQDNDIGSRARDNQSTDQIWPL